MEMHILFQGKNDPPRLADIKEPVIDLSHTEKMTIVLVEGGMGSGEPSVAIITEDDEGSVILQTSFDKFLAAATAMMAGAKNYWGWVQSEGHASIVPLMSKESRIALLESIKKELDDETQSEG